MTFAPHLRLSMEGTIGGSIEKFSCSLALVPHHSAWSALEWGFSQTAIITQYLAGNFAPNFEDMAADVQNFWTRPASGIHDNAKLQMVKLAAIGPDGKYNAAPLEHAYNVGGGASTDYDICPPWQVSRKVTFETAGDLHRVKGGFYLPCPPTNGGSYDAHTDLWTVAAITACQGSVVQLLNDLANDPGFDVTDVRPSVASTGRHNKDGSVRAAPANYEITGVNVGRRPDVIRRRANKRTEARIADSSVSF